MGRPKNNSNHISATEKIENAFWKILETEGYKNITILRITQETKLNRNSIYYHFDNIEDIACKSIKHLTDSETVVQFISVLFSSDIKFIENPQFMMRIKRIHALAKSESPFLQSFVKKALINAWFENFHINSTRLSDTDYLILDFISSGITSMLGSDLFMSNPEALQAIPTTEIGKAALRTLQQLSS